MVARKCRRMIGAVALTALLSLGATGTGYAQAADPKVPPGQDPGGPALALIGGGIDYTSAKIAHRLARDGEGEPISWDLIDNDRTAFARAIAKEQNNAPVVEGATAGKSGASSESALANSSGGSPDPSAHLANHDDTRPAELLLSAYTKARLIPVRLPPADPHALAKAIAFATGTPARIIVITQPLSAEPLQDVVRQAATRFRDYLFVVAGDITGATAGGASSDAASKPLLKTLDNVVVVISNAETDGKAPNDVAAASNVVIMPRAGTMFGDALGQRPPGNGAEAVALAAAAAACQQHGQEAPLTGPAAKVALLDASRPHKEAPAVRMLDPMCWYGGQRQ